MSKVAAKANRAQGLRTSKAFQEFHQEVMDAQTAVFMNPSASSDEIAEAHAIIRALRKIIDRMGAAEFDHKLAVKREEKGQHRGND